MKADEPDASVPEPASEPASAPEPADGKPTAGGATAVPAPETPQDPVEDRSPGVDPAPAAPPDAAAGRPPVADPAPAPVSLPDPVAGRPSADGATAASAPVTAMRGGRHWALWAQHAGLACCAVEAAAASAGRGDRDRLGDVAVVEAERANVLLVSGTVTDRMLPLVLDAYERMDRPRYVVSFGACATSGGPYWDSYSVTKGIDQVLPVDAYVPGCPPRPEALLEALDTLATRTGEGAS